MNSNWIFMLFFSSMWISGCSVVTDIPKTLWGSSTRALEKAKTEAITKAYKGTFEECFEAVLTLDRQNKNAPVTKEKLFDVFIQNNRKKLLVVIGIEGNVDTTEVGIFFTVLRPTLTQLEVTSLSSSAKRKVAEAVFKELDARFSAAD